MNKIITRPRVLRTIFGLVMAGCLTIIGLATAACLSGCATATVDVPACDTQSTNLGTVPSFPPGLAPPATVSLPPAPVSFDISDALKKVSDVADSTQVTVTSLTIDNTSGDLSWVRSVNVTITGSATDGSTPEIPFASGQWSGDPGGTLSLSLASSMTGDKVLSYLQSGQVTLKVAVTGDPSAMALPAGTQLQNSVSLCVDAQGTISKSL